MLTRIHSPLLVLILFTLSASSGDAVYGQDVGDIRMSTPIEASGGQTANVRTVGGCKIITFTSGGVEVTTVGYVGEDSDSWAPLWWHETMCWVAADERASPVARIIAFAVGWLWCLGLVVLFLQAVAGEPLDGEDLGGMFVLPGVALVGLALLVGVINALLGLFSFALTGSDPWYIDFYFGFFVLTAIAIAGPAAFIFYFVVKGFVKSESLLRRGGLGWGAKALAALVITVDVLAMVLTVRSFAMLFLGEGG